MAANTPIMYRNQMIYSIFVRQYGKHGTFADVREDLARIKALGTDIIWLMPIHPIGKKSRKGTLGSPYAIADYRAVNPELGTLDDFIRLTEAVHEQGMRIIIDVVYNHTAPDSVLAAEHPDWFYHREDGSFGNRVGDWWDIIDLDLTNADLQQYLIDSLVYWAGYVDGFRCDVAPVVPVDFWMRARAAVEKVRPGAFWLAESVQPGFVAYRRGMGYDCHSDSELYAAFDALYDYDIYDDLVEVWQHRAPLAKYLDSLNRQETTYPANYIKAHFVENHDQPRLADCVPDPVLRRHWTAFSLFAKGIGFVYNGQERSAVGHPSLFEHDPIDWSGEDVSPLIEGMMQIKRDPICAEGSFTATELTRGVAKAVYRRGDEELIGFFRLQSPPVGIDTGLDEGTFCDELSGCRLSVFHGIVALDEAPVIVRRTIAR